jgi:type IX secretion system PorP/SprF family membrane protein
MITRKQTSNMKRMKTLKKVILVLVLASGSLRIIAQQAPMYTHYMYNTLSVNPAYAGSRDALTLTALHRSQWIGFKGAPVTQTFTMHTPLRNEHVGIGLTVLNDKIGPTNNTSVFVDYAYRIKLSEKSKLAFGLSAGINIYNANLNSLQLDQQTDPSFQNNVNNHVTPNFGFGAYYSRERFYAGISAPNLLQNSYVANSNSLTGKEQRHYFLIAGTMLKIAENLDFKPTTLIKITRGAPVQADLTASFIILKRLLVGVMYRTGDSFGGLVGFDITEQLHLGYSYDWSYGLRTGTYNHGSHELILRYDILFNKKQIHSPRNF